MPPTPATPQIIVFAPAAAASAGLPPSSFPLFRADNARLFLRNSRALACLAAIALSSGKYWLVSSVSMDWSAELLHRGAVVERCSV